MLELNPEDILSIYNEYLYIDVNNISNHRVVTGQFEQRILVLFLESDYNAGTETMLQKMMASCKLEQKDTYFVALKDENQLLAIVQHYNPITVVSFGLTFQGETIRFNRSAYKPFRFNNIKFLLSDSLTKLNSDDQLKRTLWTNGLKPLFIQ